MTRRPLALSLLIAALASFPAGRARAQSVRMEPAETIRVVERADRRDGRRSREVVVDLAPAEVLLVQVALDEAGFGFGRFTAELDGSTRAALRRFQIERGLSICGCVSYETVVALGIVPRVVTVEEAYAERDVTGGRVIVVTRDRFRDEGRRGAPVVVGAGGRNGVYVGHRPARGSGHASDRRPTRPRPGGSVGRRTPPRPRAGGPIRGGDRGGSSDRPARPSPR